MQSRIRIEKYGQELEKRMHIRAAKVQRHHAGTEIGENAENKSRRMNYKVSVKKNEDYDRNDRNLGQETVRI